MYSRLFGAHDGVNVVEDEICLPVSAPTFPPSLNHSFVVFINPEVNTAAAG